MIPRTGHRGHAFHRARDRQRGVVVSTRLPHAHPTFAVTYSDALGTRTEHYPTEIARYWGVRRLTLRGIKATVLWMGSEIPDACACGEAAA